MHNIRYILVFILHKWYAFVSNYLNKLFFAYIVVANGDL